MADIFISYAHEDKEFVVALHDALARAAVRCGSSARVR